MKRLLYFVILVSCLVCCKKEVHKFILEGNIPPLVHDTIYIYGADALYENIDTVIVENGVFHYTANVDTVTPMWVLFPNMHRVMLFADKGLKATIQGDSVAFGRISILGGEQNALLNTFYTQTDSIDDVEKMTHMADSFIRANPYSEVSIFLLRQYFVDSVDPDYTKINSLIGSMSGNLQDNNYIRQLQQTLNSQKSLEKNSFVSNFNVNDINGQNVSTAEYKDDYLLISFWASWDAESRQHQRELIAIKEKYSKHNFDILSVSLDTHRDTWLQAVTEDSVTWRQACDFDGWKTGIAKRLQVNHLPFTVLLNPSRRVQAIDLYGEELDKRIGELIKEMKSSKSTNKKTPQNIRSLKGQ